MLRSAPVFVLFVPIIGVRKSERNCGKISIFALTFGPPASAEQVLGGLIGCNTANYSEEN